MPPVHPDVQAVLAAARAAGSKPFETMSPREARTAYLARREFLQLPAPAVAEKRDIAIAGPGGALALRLYRGAGTSEGEPLPCLLFIHGGGWVLGNLESHDEICCTLANEAACCVLAVDYRLAPEHPFPAAVEDCAAALAWLADNAVDLGIDAGRLAVGGDSAGGNLAAVVALMSRDGALPRLVYQLLLYPAADLAITAESYGEATDGMTITPATMRYFLRHYLPPGSDASDWRASPLRARTLAGLPPALVLTCGHDPLAAEGRRYAERLAAEDVPVTTCHVSDQTHGMLTMSKVVRATAPTLTFVGAKLRDAWRTAASSV
ncbi:MAG: acetyl esterase [Variibacter sp.]|jgi:acetyl esterase|nr:acetyl esterase [Variibacter sp.]